ncbi:MAG: hypothetical protein LUF29_01140 [Oscillospiraceae bacterium]|nr:hypothetical protein [Oscillospiraceae bacterium]
MIDPLFFDTDGLSAFLWIKGESLLTKLYPGRIFIPAQVYNELSNPCVPQLKRRIDSVVNSGQAKIVHIDYGTDASAMYRELTENPKPGHKIIGSGEAAAIVLAVERDGIIVSNNLRDISQYVEEYNIRNLTTGDILKEALNRGFASQDDCETMWQEMRSKKRKLGFESFAEYLSRNQ